MMTGPYFVMMWSLAWLVGTIILHMFLERLWPSSDVSMWDRKVAVRKWWSIACALIMAAIMWAKASDLSLAAYAGVGWIFYLTERAKWANERARSNIRGWLE